MKWAWVLFTVFFAFISTQQVVKFKSFDAKIGFELELEKSSEKKSNENKISPLFYISTPSLFQLHGPKFFGHSQYFLVPIILSYDVRFEHTDPSPPFLT